MPGLALSTPASHVPAVLVTTPFAYSAVSSPKYQTLPPRSCAYQSTVFSFRVWLTVTTSRTTTQGTPMIVLRSWVTVTSTRWGWPSFVPVYTHLVPGFHGRYALLIRALNRDGTIFGS